MRGLPAPRALALLLVVLLLGAACASGQLPAGQSIAAADYAIAKAEEDGGAEYAPVVMRQAKDKLARARVERDKKRHDRARRLANEATVEAQLADAMARHGRATAELTAAERRNRELQAEIERSGRR